MSFTMTSTVRKVSDHFEPEAAMSPQEQRALRGHLEQIDFAAFAANREILAKALGHADLDRFQRLAISAAHARARWAAAHNQYIIGRFGIQLFSFFCFRTRIDFSQDFFNQHTSRSKILKTYLG